MSTPKNQLRSIKELGAWYNQGAPHRLPINQSEIPVGRFKKPVARSPEGRSRDQDMWCSLFCTGTLVMGTSEYLTVFGDFYRYGKSITDQG